ncbi:Uncharacterised protein [Staphylococcus aureus]|nr:Uncharacterised protein [Staphylococcus aureus]
MAIKLNIKEYDPEMIVPALTDLDELKIKIHSITERIDSYLTGDIEKIINERIQELKEKYNVDYDSFI